MPVVEFGEFLPDQPDLDNPGVLEAKNVIPAARGYLPVSALSVTSDALDDRAQGAVQVRDKNLTVYQFAGDANKLYENVDGSWTDRSKSGGYNTGDTERWEFAPWKNKLLATNFNEHPQSITFGDAQFADLTTDLKARHIAVVRDFVLLANTNDTTDGLKPDRVRWSAIDDATDWTVSATTLSDFQDLKTGVVDRVFGGEFGVIMQTDSIWRMTFTGSDTVFQFDNVVPDIGVIAPGAATQLGSTIYFLSSHGFFQILNGNEVTPIGKSRVDEFVLDDLDMTWVDRISSAADATGTRIWWAYPGSGNSSGRPNKIIIYDVTLDKWSRVEDDVQLLWGGGGLGTTLEGLDSISSSLDALGPSLDSRAWVGGVREISAFDENNKSGLFSGSNMTATITTGERQFSEGRRTFIERFRNIVDGGTATVEVGTRNRQSDSVTFGGSLSERDSGDYVTRSTAQYHRFRFTISGAWTEAVGMQVDQFGTRQGGRRG